MCVVGAAWDKEKARDLGGTHLTCAIFGGDTHSSTVGTDTLTTFYVAALSERPATVRRTGLFHYAQLTCYSAARTTTVSMSVYSFIRTREEGIGAA